RFTGRFSPEQLGALVLAWREGRPVRLADLATIDVRPPTRQFFAYQNGNPAIGIRVLRANGANVLATLDAVKAAVAELRAGPLTAHGLGIEQSFDASLFIRRAVRLLTENLVAGALLASTATTVAVFVPVLFLKDVEGQLFGDLALTISIAVAISVVAALTLLPVALSFALDRPLPPSGYGQGWPWLTEWVLRVTDTRARQLSWIAGLLVFPLLLTWWMLPPLDYLPPVKRAAIDAFFDFPPGMSSEAVNRELLPTMLERMRPYMEGRQEPRLKNWYILTWPGGGTIGARVIEERRIGELERLVRDKIVGGLPDTRVFTVEGDLFG